MVSHVCLPCFFNILLFRLPYSSTATYNNNNNYNSYDNDRNKNNNNDKNKLEKKSRVARCE